MTSAPRLGASRLTTALLAATVASVSVAALGSPAFAGQNQPAAHREAARVMAPTAAQGTLRSAEKNTISAVGYSDHKVHHPEVYDLATATGEILRAYCVKVRIPPKFGASYQEVDWDNAFKANGPRIQWILAHSFPNIDNPKVVAKAAGVKHPEKDKDLVRDVVSGTQSAIWHYSDGINPDVAGKNAIRPAARQIYTYLTAKAKADQPEPPVSLSLTPHHLTGHDGATLGPITLHTNRAGREVTLTLAGDAPAGVRLVDAHGEPADRGGDGDTFGVRVPKGTPAGQIAVTAHGAATVTVGRVFAGAAGAGDTQTLILARSQVTQAHDVTAVSWSPVVVKPTPSATPTAHPNAPTTPTQTEVVRGALAHTGSDHTGLLIGAGVALVALGGGLVFALRRKNRASASTTKS